jgi:hypothetical protein
MIVAIFGYKQSGKSAIADRFQKHDFVRHSVATPLKNMLKAIGLTDEQLYGSEKEVPCDLLGGKTPRWAMQSLGSDWGRNCIDRDIWIRAWANTTPQDRNIVCDDLRFPNEASVLHTLDAWILKVIRPGVGCTSMHESEAWIDELPYHHLFYNDGSLEDLNREVDVFLDQHKGAPQRDSYGLWPCSTGGVYSGIMRKRLDELLAHMEVDSGSAQDRPET